MERTSAQETSKIMINSTNNISADISMNSQKSKVTGLKYLGATLCKDCTCSCMLHPRPAPGLPQQWPD